MSRRTTPRVPPATLVVEVHLAGPDAWRETARMPLIIGEQLEPATVAEVLATVMALLTRSSLGADWDPESLRVAVLDDEGSELAIVSGTGEVHR